MMKTKEAAKVSALAASWQSDGYKTDQLIVSQPETASCLHHERITSVAVAQVVEFTKTLSGGQQCLTKNAKRIDRHRMTT